MKKRPAKKPADIGNHNTQHSLAAALQMRYGDLIAIVIDDEAVKSWRKGLRLDRGTPPPPAKRGNYFVGTEWMAWVEKWIIPKHGHDAKKVDLAMLAQEAKYRTTILNEQREQIEVDILDGKYMLKSEASKIIAGLGQTLNAIQNNRLELRARVAIKERMQAANLPEDTAMVELVCAYLKETNAILKEEIRTQIK